MNFPKIGGLNEKVSGDQLFLCVEELAEKAKGCHVGNLGKACAKIFREPFLGAD